MPKLKSSKLLSCLVRLSLLALFGASTLAWAGNSACPATRVIVPDAADKPCEVGVTPGCQADGIDREILKTANQGCQKKMNRQCADALLHLPDGRRLVICKDPQGA